MRLTVVLTVTICLVALSVAPAAAGELTREQVIQDLRFFRDVYAAKERAWSPEARGRMAAYIDAQIAVAGSMTRARLALVFARAQAFSDNNHTQNDLFDDEDDFHVLPIAFWWFTEGAVITRAHPAQRDLIGARILAIGGVPIKRAAEQVAPFISGTPWRKHYESVNWLRRIEVLNEVGLGDSGGADVLLETSDGRRFVRHLGPTPSRDPAVLTLTWRESMVPGKGAPPWPQATDHLAPLPLYLQPPTDLSSAVLDGGRVLYVRSTQIQNIDDAHSLAAKAYEMFDTVLKNRPWPRHAVVDLRFNDGGDFLKITDLARELVAMTGPCGRIYVITGRATNSASIIFAAMLKAAAADRTLIVGEQMSDHGWFWSEGGYLKAPASGLGLRYTDGYHDWEHGCVDTSRCYWPGILLGASAGSLAPDIEITHSYKDYAAGQDPDLDTVLLDLNRRPDTCPGRPQ